MSDLLLEVKNLVKEFPGTVALDGMDFDLRRGEVRAVVGENGAGKSTLMKILSGAYTKSSGTILFEGKEIEHQSVKDSQVRGISMIYQELENVSKLSVAENIFLGRLPRSRFPGFVDFRQLYSETRASIQDYGLDIDPKARLSSLTVAQQQFVEIIKAVTVKNAKIIIMDEPTSSLTKEETDRLFEIIRGLKKKNISVIYISHRLDEVTGIADAISVFRDGKNRGTLKRDDFQREKILTLMVGHDVEKVEKKPVVREKVVFEVRNLEIAGKVHNFSLKLYEREILGIAGLMGSGKDELVKSLFGLWPTRSKEIYYNGKRIDVRKPLDAVRHGIVYLPEERKRQSLFLELTVRENIIPLWLYNDYRGMITDVRKERDLSQKLIEKLEIRTPGTEEEIVGLSGGNQQKAIFSRLLAVKPKVMILNDPTRGVDVKSKEAIYGFIRELAESGTSILFLSSEIPEINYLANRAIVLSKGEIFGEFKDDEVTTKNILTAATRA
ncbi:MAG: sugar ABC transporter ATP-binding protein [Syntrophales bacterium]